MITPYVTTAQLADKYPSIEAGSSKHTIVYYTHQGVDYHSAIKLFRSIDDQRLIICPTCGCPVRQLTHYEDRPGLCCVDDITKRRSKDDTLPKVVRRGKATKPTTKRKALSLRSKARKAA